MRAWDAAALEAARLASDEAYHEVMSVPDLSVGLYVLEAGAVDPQSPHTEDELYVVLEGKGRIRVGEEELDVARGSVVFVAATVPHRFIEVTERLALLVVFGPAEGSRSVAGRR